MSELIILELVPPTEETESCGEKETDQVQTTDLLTRRAELMLFLEEKVLIDQEEVDPSPAALSSFISSLEDREWQSVQDRMVEPVSQIHLAQVSGRIIRVVSELVLQLLVPALQVQLQPEDQPTKADSESEQEPQSNRPAVALKPVPGDLHKYFEVTKETLAQSLGRSASQSSVSSMLGDVVKQLNQGLCVLAAQSQTSKETEGSEVTSGALRFLALPGQTLADVTDEAVDRDEDALLETTTEEVMFAIADSTRICQDKERKSARILRDLAVKITEQHSESCLQRLSSHAVRLKSDSGNQPELSARSKCDVHTKPYRLLVSSKKVSGDLSESRGSCLQVLTGLLAKLLALFSPQSFSLMTGPYKTSLPNLECVASDILDIVVNGVKEICQKKKSTFPLRRHKKTKVTDKQVHVAAAEMKVALQEKLREFLTCHKKAVEKSKKDQMEKVKKTVSTLLSNLRDKIAESEDTEQEQRSTVQIITSAVRTLLYQVDICSDDRDKSTLNRLEDLICEDKLSSVSQVLLSPLSLLLSGPVSPAEQVRLFGETAVKHLLSLFFLPPLSWGMGLAIRVKSSSSSTARFAESAQLYDNIISQYAQVMSDQVMRSLSRSSAAFWLQLEVDSFLDVLEICDSEPKQKKKIKNILHFFQKLPRKIQKMEGGVDASEPRRRMVAHFFQTLSDRIQNALRENQPAMWHTHALFPI